MRVKQALIKSTWVQKDNWGNHAFSDINELQFQTKMHYIVTCCEVFIIFVAILSLKNVWLSTNFSFWISK